MIIGSVNEFEKEETRVSLTPLVVKRLISENHVVLLEKKFGIKAGFEPDDYVAAGAQFFDSVQDIYAKSQILLQILPPESSLINLLAGSQLLAADFRNFDFEPVFSEAVFLRLELVPRISVAQSVDILSAQDTVRGYMAALYALNKLPRIAPQLMTAAASLKAAQAVVIGASVTGLQAASVLKRVGCRVTILDVVEKNRELAKSVGADFAIALTPEELTSVLNGKHILIAAAGSGSNSMQIVNAEQLRFLARNAVIVDTTAQNIGIRENTSMVGSRRFYRGKYLERQASLSASELWANNMYNLIKLICTQNNAFDLSLNYVAPMRYLKEAAKESSVLTAQKTGGASAVI